MGNSEQVHDFESVKARLADIAELVEDEALSLDDALDLYEEAVALGLQASDLLETGIEIPEEAEDSQDSEQRAEATMQPQGDSTVGELSQAPSGSDGAADGQA